MKPKIKIKIWIDKIEFVCYNMRVGKRNINFGFLKGETKMKVAYQYHGFMIVEEYGDYVVYGTSANTMKYGFVRVFPTAYEAEQFINSNFGGEN